MSRTGDFVSAIQRLALQDTGRMKFENESSKYANGLSSIVARKQYGCNTRSSLGNTFLKAGSNVHSAPVSLKTGDAMASMCSESRGEAGDFARIRNTCFEQATQAYMLGNKALAKELNMKGQLYNLQMKAAHETAREAIYQQRNPFSSEQGQDRLIDLHGLQVSEAIQVVKAELALLMGATRTKYQKNVEASHNKGLKTVPNSIRSENYVITFEVEEEKFPFFGKKYQLKFANESMFENHCLVHFPSFMRTQFAPLLGGYGSSLVDPRGKLVARSFDILGDVAFPLQDSLKVPVYSLPDIISAGLYSTFVFQKPDPDAMPPIVTPELHDPENDQEEEWLWAQQASMDDGRVSRTDMLPPADNEKGILGPGPADMRL
uniref:DUF1771 domain-containing protein n=1 Tax=Oryza meridionalis TaxID=40149 RepID=A0A0E0CBD8_9ORYZ